MSKRNELKMMDGSSSTNSYVVIGDNGEHQIGIKLAFSSHITGVNASAMVRLAVKPDREPESIDWNALWPGINWQVAGPDRARTTVFHEVRGVNARMEESFAKALHEKGDFIYGPLLDELYARVPDEFKTDEANSIEDVKADVYESLLERYSLEQEPVTQDLSWYSGVTEHQEEYEDEGV